MSLPAGFLDQPLAHYTSHVPLDRRPENSWAAGEVAPGKGCLTLYSACECGERELCNQNRVSQACGGISNSFEWRSDAD